MRVLLAMNIIGRVVRRRYRLKHLLDATGGHAEVGVHIPDETIERQILRILVHSRYILWRRDDIYLLSSNDYREDFTSTVEIGPRRALEQQL